MEDKHIVAVDIGSSKVALTIAKVTGDDIQVIYYGTAPSAGVRNNYVINSMQVTKPLEALIREAENELNIKITQAVVGMPKYRVRQETRPARIERVNPDSCITDEEVDILKNGALDSYPLDDAKNEELFGAVAQSFSNGEEFQLIEDEVIGMPSDILEGNFKIFIGKKSALRAINVTFNNLKIAIAKKYFTPDVLAKAVLTPSETDNGVALIDFGGGSTSVSVYYGGIMNISTGVRGENELLFRDLTLDVERRQVYRAGREIRLLPKEFSILECLMRGKGNVLSRRQIEDSIWNYDDTPSSNNVDVYISKLRKKIDGDSPVKLLHTIRGVGWVLREDGAAALSGQNGKEV